MNFSLSKWWKRLLLQNSSSRTYDLFDQKWFTGISTFLVIALMTFGSVIFVYSKFNECIEYTYKCDQGVDSAFTFIIPQSFAGKSSVYIYSGLDDFYPSYQTLKNSYSSVQLQSVPRSLDNLPYAGCDSFSTLTDMAVSDVFFPVSAFATSVDWAAGFNLTEVMDLTLRPCGALFYWIPTDTFTFLHAKTSALSWDQLEMPSDPGPFPYIDSTTGEFVWADPSTQEMRAWLRANVDPNSFVLKQGVVDFEDDILEYTVNVSRCRDLQASRKFMKLCTTSWIGTDGIFLSSVSFIFASIIFIALVLYTIRRN